MASSGGRSDYFKEYYARNRERILAKKREIYKDPVIKKRIKKQKEKDRTRDRRIKLLKDKTKEVKAVGKSGSLMRVIHPTDPSRSAVVEMFRVGIVAEKSTVPKKTFLSWIANNKIPAPLYRTGRGWRVYTQYETELLSEYLIWLRRSLWMRGYRLRIDAESIADLTEKFSSLLGGVPEEKYIKTETEEES